MYNKGFMISIRALIRSISKNQAKKAFYFIENCV